MSSNPDISVIIPTADRQDLLHRAVRSVLGQTYPAAKIIIVDNGLVCAELTIDDPAIEVIRTAPRLGVGKPRNIGAQYCKTEYMAFLDDDDYWEKDYLEKVMDCFSRSGADVVVAQQKHYGPDGALISGKVFPVQPRALRKIFYGSLGFGGTNITVKKEAFMAVGGFDEKLPASEDRDLAARFITADMKIVGQPEAVVIVGHHIGDRASAHRNIVKGRWMFIRKHRKDMSAYEKCMAARRFMQCVRRFLKRWIVGLFARNV